MTQIALNAAQTVERSAASSVSLAETLRDALIITRREIRDSLRDWRIVAPILILTLVFPWIMNATTRVAIDFVEQYNATIIPLRLIPFGLMVVGFFPITFSLVIALETFVGEKERNSLEPLLGAPLSDASLYLGKLVAATALPLFASYIGVAAYLAWLFVSIRYVPDWMVLVQILLLTTMEALVMVTGAVVVSAHTTSVRAANLLASFIIIPMAFLLQAESILLFWGNYAVLWSIIAGLVTIDLILIRMGIQTFNREEILAREVDELNPRRILRQLLRQFSYGEGWSLRWLVTCDLPRILGANRLPIAITSVTLVATFVGGWVYASQFPLPPELAQPLHVQPDLQSRFVSNAVPLMPQLDMGSIFWHNARTLLLAAVLGMPSFGSAALMLPMVTIGLLGFITAEVSSAGTNPLLFLGAFILPHGIFEIPAVVLATAFALRAGASVIAGTRRGTGEGFTAAVADWIKVFVFLVVPLLIVGAIVEANITPRLVLYFFGG